MSTIHLLETRRVEAHAASIRKRLASLRRAKAMGVDLSTTSQRNPTFDNALCCMIDTYRELEKETAKFRMNEGKLPDATAILSTAETVLLDTAEMIELLLWLGARPLEEGSGTLTWGVENSVREEKLTPP